MVNIEKSISKMKIQLTGNLLIRNEDYFSWLFVGLIFPTIGLLGLFENNKYRKSKKQHK